MAAVAHRLDAGIQRSGRGFVQQWLPDVHLGRVDQDHVGLALSTEATTQARGDTDPAGATADDHNAGCGHQSAPAPA